MAKFMDSWKVDQADGTRSIVDDYTFITMDMDTLFDRVHDFELNDLSNYNKFTMNLYSLSSNYYDVANPKFYKPSEVNGMPGESLISGEKQNAYKAIYDFEPSGKDPSEFDSLALLLTYQKIDEQEKL